MSKNRVTTFTSKKFKKLQEFSRAIAVEKDHQKLLELILAAIKNITSSDGGTLYTKTKENTLKFSVVTNTSLNFKLGGTYKTPIPFKDLNLFEGDGFPNYKNICCYAALKNETIILKDAYCAENFNFSGTKAFDLQTGYRTKSVLTMPLRNLQGEVIGVIQLINSLDSKGKSIPFSLEDVDFAKLFASYASITLTNFDLYNKFEKLFFKFSEVLATAIDNKSAYTGKHCKQVHTLSMMITKASMRAKHGPFKNFTLSKQGFAEMELATLLHDFGKICTPTHIVDKATKLETIFDRISLIRTRFEVLKKQFEIDFLNEKMELLEKNQKNKITKLEAVYRKKIESLDKDLQFIQKANIGQENMSDLDVQRINNIAKHKWLTPDGVMNNILNIDEIENLTIKKGTLTNKERDLINEHSYLTLTMLTQLEFPDHLKNVPDIAGSHHEKINGKGHPRKLKGDEISLQARILGIADVFEALTSRDRPYKKGKTLKESLNIMGKMVEADELDIEIFNLFLDKKIYLEYAEQYLDAYQVVDIDIESLAGRKIEKTKKIKRSA